MLRHHRSGEVPSLNTTSTADISFMLLIFFLVTSSMDTDKGLLRRLPPAPQAEEQTLDVRQEDVLRVRIDADDHLTCQGDTISDKTLTLRAAKFIKEHGERHVVSVQVDRKTSYDAYFHMQSALVRAYRGSGQRQRISEEEPTDSSNDNAKGGGRHD